MRDYSQYMKVRIIGAGAVGAVVGWKLYKHADLAFIVDEERKERYSGGLAVNGEVIDFRFLTPAEADTADLLIFAVKNFSLEDAADEAAPFVGENTVILSLLNGIEAEEKLSERFGAEKVLYGFITDLSSVHDGTETTCFSGGGNIVFSEKDNALVPLTQKQEREFAAFNEYVNIYFSSARKSSETEQPFTRRDRFDELYRDMIGLPKKERRANLVSAMRQDFETQALTERFVDENLERKRHNLICRRQRLARKAYLQDFNFFVTFTFDGKNIPRRVSAAN